MTVTEPSVSIIIPIRNALTESLKCLESLQKVDYSNYNIIVVDNDSDDGSPAAIEGAFPNVRVVRNSENLGFAEGCNTGIREAIRTGADYLWLLNNDTVVDRESLKTLVRVAEEDKNIGMTGSKIYHYGTPNLIQSAGMKVNWIRGETQPVGWNQHDNGQFNECRDVEALHGCSFLIKRSICAEVGLIDKEYFLYAEEIDWCIRAKLKGFRCVFVPQSIVFHKGGASSGNGFTPLFYYYNTRNMLRTISKTFSFPRRQFYLCTAIGFKLWNIRRNLLKAAIVKVFGIKTYTFDIIIFLGVIDFILNRMGVKDRNAIMSFQNINDR